VAKETVNDRLRILSERINDLELRLDALESDEETNDEELTIPIGAIVRASRDLVAAWEDLKGRQGEVVAYDSEEQAYGVSWLGGNVGHNLEGILPVGSMSGLWHPFEDLVLVDLDDEEEFR
jgi:hypothetical protein